MVQIFEEFKEYIVNGIVALVGAVGGYFLNKRKDTAEVEVTETDVIKSIRELYTNLVDDMKSTIQDLKNAKEHLELLSKETTTLRNNLAKLEKDLQDCRDNLQKTSNIIKKE